MATKQGDGSKVVSTKTMSTSALPKGMAGHKMKGGHMNMSKPMPHGTKNKPC